MLMKRCVRCGALFSYSSSSRCPDCEKKYQAEAPKIQADTAKRYNRKRNQKETAFYRSKEWKTLRNWYSQKAGFKCEECGKLGTEVHHIVPIQKPEGWNRRLDPKNLKLLCTACHNKIHKKLH